MKQYFYNNSIYSSAVYEVEKVEEDGKNVNITLKIIADANSMMRTKKSNSISGYYYMIMEDTEPFVITTTKRQFEKGNFTVINTTTKYKKINTISKSKSFSYITIQ